ncbi:hypothetical protein [Mycobacterium sp.]|uniref:hypothetical protein n=1 Tax=Mycobacterium sp. TaxID=1785 RepID=UPI00127CA241|nr:hypothetical protein [Mycobacterium sp.]KAA8959249.1 MAG: hypothetical protein F6Q13_14760 [Mycobacterium sp.]
MGSRRARRWAMGLAWLTGAAATALSAGVGSAGADTTDLVGATAGSAASTAGDALTDALLYSLWLDNAVVFLDDVQVAYSDFTPLALHHVETATPAGLLATASTNLTDANDVLSTISAPPGSEAAQFVDNQSIAVFSNSLETLQSAANIISADGGFLTPVEQLVVTPAEQDWVQASTAMLHADQALATAVTGNTGLDAAELGVVHAGDLLTMAELNSFPALFIADVVGAV